MEYRKLGRADLTASAIGLGCSRVGSLLGAQGASEARRALARAIDLGITYFDTADIYGQGDSERILGDVVRPVRSRVILASKCGYRLSTTARLARFAKPVLARLTAAFPAARAAASRARQRGYRQDFSPDYIVAAVDGSLRRLRTDYLDVLLLHEPPIAAAGQEEILAALRRLIDLGKVRMTGVSCATVAETLPWLGASGIDIVQVPMGPLRTEALASLLPSATAGQIAVVGREPYHGGHWFRYPQLLAARAEEDPSLAALRDKLRAFRLSPAQVALQFVLRLPSIAVALPGMTSVEHVEDAVAVFDRKEISDTDFAALRAIARLAEATMPPTPGGGSKPPVAGDPDAKR